MKLFIKKIIVFSVLRVFTVVLWIKVTLNELISSFLFIPYTAFSLLYIVDLVILDLFEMILRLLDF